MSYYVRDDQLVELATLIADRLAERAAGELIDAGELAKRIGRTREFVYDHSAAFGAVRLGDGHRPRLWFRWPHALDRLAELEERPKRKAPRATATNRPRRERSQSKVELLPVNPGRGARSQGAKR